MRMKTTKRSRNGKATSFREPVITRSRSNVVPRRVSKPNPRARVTSGTSSDVSYSPRIPLPSRRRSRGSASSVEALLSPSAMSTEEEAENPPERSSPPITETPKIPALPEVVQPQPETPPYDPAECLPNHERYEWHRQILDDIGYMNPYRIDYHSPPTFNTFYPDTSKKQGLTGAFKFIPPPYDLVLQGYARAAMGLPVPLLFPRISWPFVCSDIRMQVGGNLTDVVSWDPEDDGC